jgi:hypothetical protein
VVLSLFPPSSLPCLSIVYPSSFFLFPPSSVPRLSLVCPSSSSLLWHTHRIIQSVHTYRNTDPVLVCMPTLSLVRIHIRCLCPQLPRILFNLRRGPLIGPVLQHTDDIEAMRDLFLRASVPDALRLMSPRILMMPRPSPNPTKCPLMPVPLETLALQSNVILVLDAHSDIFLWTGRDVSGDEFAPLHRACERAARSMGKGRFPVPSFLSFKEGSSASRWLMSRLVPSHGVSGDAGMGVAGTVGNRRGGGDGR